MAQLSSRSTSQQSRPLRRLGVGVLGLGRRWQSRYLPALQALRDRFAIRAVADPVAVRTEEEARKLECDAMAGPMELLENPGVEAVLLLDEAWYGLWPIEAACRVGKPIFCAAVGALAKESKELCEKVQERRLPVLMALAPRLAAPTQRAQELLQNELGPVRVIVAESVSAGRQNPTPPALLGPSGIGLMDWCLALIGRPPVSGQAVAASSGVLASVLVEFADGASAQIIRRDGTGRTSGMRLELAEEQGSAEIELPNRIRWRTPAGQRLERLASSGNRTRLLLKAFHHAVTEGQSMQPNLDDAWTAMQCLRAADASLSADGRRVAIS